MLPGKWPFNTCSRGASGRHDDTGNIFSQQTQKQHSRITKSTELLAIALHFSIFSSASLSWEGDVGHQEGSQLSIQLLRFIGAATQPDRAHTEHANNHKKNKQTIMWTLTTWHFGYQQGWYAIYSRHERPCGAQLGLHIKKTRRRESTWLGFPPPLFTPPCNLILIS